MICLECKHRFTYEGWKRIIKCPKCEGNITASSTSYDANIGYEKDLKEAKKVLRKKWGL